MNRIDRRKFLAGCAVSALLAGGVSAFAQGAVNVDDLHTPGQLGDKVLGPADAPVTVVEYASLSCPHCAHFDSATFDQFRLKYVDSGKVRYIFREFPLNFPAYAGAMVARCAPADRYFDVLHAFFRGQEAWLNAPDIKASTLEVAKRFGFTPQTYEACLANQALFEGVEAVKGRGVAFGVKATPTFFVNGKKLEGALSLEQLDAEIEPLLGT